MFTLLHFHAKLFYADSQIRNPKLPVTANINADYAIPRSIIPFGVPAVVDIENQVIRIEGTDFPFLSQQGVNKQMSGGFS